MNAKVKTIVDYKWVVIDPELLGGQPAIRGTRLSVSHILACLAEGMTAEQIARDYPGFPAEAVPEVLRFASEQVDKLGTNNVAA